MGFLSRFLGGSDSFNVREIHKIEKAIRGKAEVRNAVARAVQEAWREIVKISEVEDDRRQREATTALLNRFTAARRSALAAGAASHGDPTWAPPAVVETWLQTLLLGKPGELEQIHATLSKILGSRFPPSG